MNMRTLLIAPLLLTTLAACGDDDGGGAAGDFCTAARALEGDTGDNFFEAETPEDVEESFNELRALLNEAADSAPDDLSDEIDAIVDAYNSLGEGLEANDWDFIAFASSPDAEDIFADIEAVDFTPVDEYLEEECGIATES